MPDRLNVILVTLDGVGAHWLGPYGNTWGETPAWNRAAAEGLLFESAYATSPHVLDSCRSLWRDWRKLPARPTLLTDSREVAESAAAVEGFEERILYPLAETASPAPTIESTHCVQLLASTGEWVREATQPFSLCVHASALYGPWDAPYSLRLRVADEEDPDPPQFVAPPRATLEAGFDPDTLLGFMQAHAGQMAVIDWALHALFDDLENAGLLEQSIVVVTSSRGFALGEHGEVGGVDDLFGEHLQVPCLIRFPGERYAAQRSQRILSLSDLASLLGAALRNDDDLERQLAFTGELADADRVAFATLADRYAVRTPCWFLTMGGGGEDRLFAKPDDRWEVNEVSSLCPDAVQEMRALIAKRRDCGPADVFDCELSELMTRGYDG